MCDNYASLINFVDMLKKLWKTKIILLITKNKTIRNSKYVTVHNMVEKLENHNKIKNLSNIVSSYIKNV